MRILNRIFVGGLVLLAVFWAGAFVVDWTHRADDQKFYRDKVAPSVSGGPQSFDTQAMSEWLDRSQRHGDNAWLRTKLFLGAGGWVMGWVVLMLIRNEVFWKRRNASDRAADPQAGVVVREARNYGSVLTARSAKLGLHFLPVRMREVEVDFATQTVEFRGFKFITEFIGNQTRPSVKLPFADILGGRVWVNHGSQMLNLRTTSGAVTISDGVRPFPPLASVLLDIAEQNRADPTAYAAARAREPKIQTPWYGWLIFAIALAAVAAFAIFLWRLQPR